MYVLFMLESLTSLLLMHGWNLNNRVGINVNRRKTDIFHTINCRVYWVIFHAFHAMRKLTTTSGIN
jgi:hypothetical protein